MLKKKLSIVADQQITNVAELFSVFGEVELADGRSINKQTIDNADVLLVRSVTKVNESLLKDSSIRFVGSATSGIDHVDLDYLRNSNITFKHAPGSNARSVAEYVLSSLFVLAEQKGFSLQDKTIGIIGCGQVGSRLKQFMQSLGIKCFLNDPPRALRDNDELWLELDEVLSADIISLHVPLVFDGDFPTLDLVNRHFLSRLKPEVVFINSSRGEVVDETALLEFKQANPDVSLILDVWRNEPNINMELLNHVEIATPHIAGYSFDGKLKATKMLFNALCEYTSSQQDVSEPDLSGHEQQLLELSSGDDLVQLAVLQSYDVRSDAIALRDMIHVPAGEQAAYFDSLRKNYPVRREFGNTTLKIRDVSTDFSQQLKQLGFNLQT